MKVYQAPCRQGQTLNFVLYQLVKMYDQFEVSQKEKKRLYFLRKVVPVVGMQLDRKAEADCNFSIGVLFYDL